MLFLVSVPFKRGMHFRMLYGKRKLGNMECLLNTRVHFVIESRIIVEKLVDQWFLLWTDDTLRDVDQVKYS